jgi:hypothetical protein
MEFWKVPLPYMQSYNFLAVTDWYGLTCPKATEPGVCSAKGAASF